MANLEETHESELDAILGELNMLEQKNEPNSLTTCTPLGNNGSSAAGVLGTGTLMGTVSLVDPRLGRSHSRSNSTLSHVTNSTISSISTSSESGTGSGSESGALREPRTDSPDNDSAFSDTVSLLSSESSASSGVSSAHSKNLPLHSNLLQVSLTMNEYTSRCVLIHVFVYSVIAPKLPKSIWLYKNWNRLLCDDYL